MLSGSNHITKTPINNIDLIGSDIKFSKIITNVDLEGCTGTFVYNLILNTVALNGLPTRLQNLNIGFTGCQMISYNTTGISPTISFNYLGGANCEANSFNKGYTFTLGAVQYNDIDGFSYDIIRIYQRKGIDNFDQVLDVITKVNKQQQVFF